MSVEPEIIPMPVTGAIPTDEAHRRRLWQLIRKMTIYYACFGAVFIVTALFVPGVSEYLPLGGVDDFSESVGLEVAEFGEVLKGDGRAIIDSDSPLRKGAADRKGWIVDAVTLFLAMLSTFLLMLPVSWVYKRIHEGDEFDHSIDETTLILPAIFAGIITVVQHSLTLAFALAGIMAGVRFRRALNDTFDTLFIFVAIGVGLAAGAASIEIAIVITVFFNYTTVLVCIFGDGLESKYEARKQLTKMSEKQRKLKIAETKLNIDPADEPVPNPLGDPIQTK